MKKNKKLVKKIVLFINTSKEKQLDVFLLIKNRIIAQSILNGNFKVSDSLLGLIDKTLKKKKIKFDQLIGIMVVSGPGPFTSIRIGVTIANTLAFALKIPVADSIIENKANNLELIKTGWQKLKKAKIGKYCRPFYDQEPNITIAKK
jgi:tRNA threonylcarbamoyladenosine biosynthesis protein TsaB